MNIRGSRLAGGDVHNFAKVSEGSAVLAGRWRSTWSWESRGTASGQPGGFRAGGHSFNIAELEARAAETATGDPMGTDARCRDRAKRNRWSISDVHSFETIYGCVDTVGGIVSGTVDELERGERGERGVQE